MQARVESRRETRPGRRTGRRSIVRPPDTFDWRASIITVRQPEDGVLYRKGQSNGLDRLAARV